MLLDLQVQHIHPIEGGELANPALLAKLHKRLEQSLNQMENIFLADQPYLCGRDISIADLLGICEVMQPVIIGYDIFANRPKLEAWEARVKERLQPHFDEAHKFVYIFRDQFKSSL